MNDTQNPMRPVGPILYAAIVYNFRPNSNWAMAANPPEEYSPNVRFVTGKNGHKPYPRYEAAITEEFGSVAKFLELTIDEMIAKSRADGRVFAQGSNFFLKTDEIVTEYDYEMELLSQIRREGGKALISSYASSLTENSFQIAELNLKETLAAMVKHRYGKQQLVNGSWVDVWP
jgi:hypothetical protein